MSPGSDATHGHRAGHRGSSPGRRRVLARLVLTALLALPVLTGVGAHPVAAAPGPDPSTDDSSSTSDRPVRIEVDRLDPASVAPGGPITLSGTLTNTGSEALGGLTVRLQRGEVFGSRDELLAADTDPDPATTVAAAFLPIAGELGPGDTMPFSYTTTTTDLQLAGDGVYPVLLNLNGSTADGAQSRVGELATYVVQQSAPPPGTTSVAWLWPLVEPSHRDAAGRFTDDGLAGEVTPGGRLDRALATVERIPEALPAGGVEPAPRVQVTLAVDPALVEELTLMAEGPYEVGGDQAGRGTDEAAAFLDRLRAVAAVHPVMALPYGDADVDALVTAGLAPVAARSLPATGTARAAVPAAGGGAAAGDPSGAGAAILRDALDVEPRTDLAWPAGDTVRAGTLAVYRDGGATAAVVTSDGVADGARARGLERVGAAARTPLTEELDGLVADGGLSLLATAATVEGGARIAEQRYLAELALLSLHPFGDPATLQTVLIAPPRRVDADPDAASAMITATGRVPGLRPGTVAEIAAGPSVDTGGLAAPADAADPDTPRPDAPGLDEAALADVRAAVAVRDDLAGAVVEDPAVVLAPYDAAAARASSAAWRADPAGARAAAADLRDTLEGLASSVTLLSPADGTYSLASSDAPLVLTVRNDLPFAVRVLLQVRTRGNVGLTVDDIGEQVLAPDRRTTLQVPTQVRQSGRFGVTASLTTPGGSSLGDPVHLQVTSTAYGVISLVITFGAAALLALLFLRRLVLFVVRRRRGPAEEDLPGAPEGAAVALPPTRSPV